MTDKPDRSAELMAVATRIVEQNHRYLEAERELDAYKESAKEWKKTLKARQATLHDLIETFERLRDGDESITLESMAAAGVPQPGVDIGGMSPLSSLKIPKGMLEKLAERDVTTVRELEAFMAAGKFVPGEVKGVGQTAIDKATDALERHRREHPIPPPAEPQTIEEQLVEAAKEKLSTLSLDTEGVEVQVVA